MKLSWFTPLPPDHTEIGNVSARILPALAAAFDLQVYTQTRAWDKGLAGACPVRAFTSEDIDWKALNTGGLPVYHVGNNIHFHGEIIPVARRCPGIVVLHDLAMHETVMNLCLLKGGGRAAYYDILQRFGGAKAVAMGREYLDRGAVDINSLATEYPLCEYVLENAQGVITHNPLNAAQIRRCTPAPVLYAPLPYRDRAHLAPARAAGQPRRGPLRIVLFGFLGSTNRRLEPFLRAFAKCPQRDRFRMTLAGTYPEKDVRAWVRDLGIGTLVAMRGYIPDSELDAVLRESDLCVNLRWPSRGESSGTLLRVWEHSLPALVTDTAFYSTLPRETVAFVRHDHEQEDIIRHLTAFAADPGPYAEMGRAGRRHLEEHHTAEAFIRHIKEFLPEVLRWRGMPHLLGFGRVLARSFLATHPDEQAREALVKRCAAELAAWQ